MNNITRTACAALAFASTVLAQSSPTAIHYQGRLTQAGSRPSGLANFSVKLFTASVSGRQLGDTVTLDDVPVVDGLFSLEMDFGAQAWAGGSRDDRYLEISVAYPVGGTLVTMTPRQKVLSTPSALKTRGIVIEARDPGNGEYVGIGPNTNPKAPLHVRASGAFRGHVAVFENENTVNPNFNANGVAIKLHRRTSRDDNFVTFYDGSDNVVGRIEGFDLQNGDFTSPPVSWKGFGPVLKLDVDFGQVPTPRLSGGRAPSLSGGRLPSASLSGGTLPSATFSRGTLPSASFNRGSLPSFRNGQFSAGSLPSLTFDPGSLPSLTFNRGAFPSLAFNAGSLPTLDPGAFPALTLIGGSPPSADFGFNLPNTQQLEDWMAWATMHDLDSLVQLDPVSLAASALKVAAKMKARDGGVVYGSKGADYAEWLPKLDPKDKFQIGQIVGVFGGKVSLKTQGADQIMAVTRAPIVLGNVPLDGNTDGHEKVAFVGQVPIVVRGHVNAGDYILPSGLQDGTAKAVSPEDLGIEHLEHLIGRAWSESENDVYSFINVVVGQRGGEVAAVFRNQDRKHEQLATANRKLQDDLASSLERTADLEARLDALEAAIETLTARKPR